jgi:hypothetical protein
VSSDAPAAAIPAGDHIVPDENIESFFADALRSGGFVAIEPWQDFLRRPDNSLELVWQWHVQVGGSIHGYKPAELMLDMAVPLHGAAAQDPDVLEQRGKVARLLGIGAPAPAPTPATVVEEQKVIRLPVAPALDYAPEDPNSFPG